MMKLPRVSAAIAAAFLVGVAWFVATCGARLLLPGNLDWLKGDWAWHELGWLYYQRDAWRFPIGFMANFPDPAGTATGYTDCMPWVAAFFKAIRFALPDSMQYLGPWLALSFGLQAVAGAKIAEIATPRRLLQLLGGALFAVSPVLLYRIGHVALCTQWLLLCAIWLNLRRCDDDAGARRALRLGALLALLTSGIHPYLAAMVMALLFAAIVRLWRIDRLVSARRALAAAGAYLGIAGVTFLVFGYLDGTIPTAGGWREYSTDLLSFVNPMGKSAILPTLPSGKGQYEGFAYLGAGVIALGLFAGVALAVRRTPLPFRRALPLLVASGLLGLYALSTRITAFGHVLLDVDFTFGRIADIFQSSGRFIWPLHYLVLTCAILATLRVLRDRPRACALVLAVALLVQVLEPRVLGQRVGAGDLGVPSDPTWQLAAGEYRRLVLYPPQLHCPPGPEYPHDFAIRLGYLAYRLGLTINSASLSRVHSGRHAAHCQALAADVAAGRLAGDAIYVVHAEWLPRIAPHARCGKLDGLDVCVSPAAAERFRAALSRPR